MSWKAKGAVGLLLSLSVAGCGKANKPALNLPDGCQPLLGGADCFMPYPSDFFRVPDAAQATGFRIETRGPARLTATNGGNADVNTQAPIDGFSRVPTLVTSFLTPVSDQGFVRLAEDPAKSTVTSSNTLILDAETGEKIPHFVDLDPRATDLSRQAISLHPVVGLKAQTRYLVAVQHVQRSDGSGPVDAPEGFRRLRDREAAGDAVLEPISQHFEESIFPALAAAGLTRSELQLAWEFTTGSDEAARKDMLAVRQLTLAWLATHTPAVTVTRVEEATRDLVWRRVEGTVEAPLFLESAEPGAKLLRDSAGVVRQGGTTVFPFVAEIPNSIRDQFGPGLALSYGHGFFGNLGELDGEGSRSLAQKLGAVVLGTEWWGMHRSDVGKIADALSGKPSRTFEFTDRVHQAMANWLVLTRAMQGPMREQPAFLRPATPGTPGYHLDGSGQSNAGQPVYAAGAPSFIGISQGHILGGVMTALNPDFSRIVLHVGGAGFTQMMMRAVPFNGYLSLLELSIHDPLEQQKYIATLQRPFDRIDPATYAELLLKSPLAGTAPDRRLLMQMGLGDSEVPNLGTFLHARLIGLPVLTPSPVVPFGLEPVAAPRSGSALAIYDFGIDTAAHYRNANPPEDSPVHDRLRLTEPAQKQMGTFFKTGVVTNPCEGLCAKL